MTPNEIAALTDQEANQRLHESKLVGKCWHNLDIEFDFEDDTGYVRQGYRCLCGVTEHMVNDDDSLDNPDYAQSWNAVIPVFQSLEGEQVAMIRDGSDQCNPDRVIYECFRIKKPRYLVNVLLQLCEEAK